MLGFQNPIDNFVNQNAKYTQSDHAVFGVEYSPGNAARITLEGFYKKYSQYPISVIDQVSMANKGGGFEVLGNEAITSNGKGKSYGGGPYQQNWQNSMGFSHTLISTVSLPPAKENSSLCLGYRHLISFSGGLQTKEKLEISAR